jgi:hypothetical protein
MDRDSIEGWHRWFGISGVFFAVLGLAVQEWALAEVGAALAAYSFGMLAVRRYRRRSVVSDESDPSTPSGAEPFLPRRNLIWGVVFALLAIGWSVATHSYSELWGVAFAVGLVALVLWWRANRSGR